MPTDIKTAANATTERKRKRSPNNRHPKGYRQPNKSGTKLVGADMPIAMADAFQLAAKAEGKTMKEILTAFVATKAKPFMAPETRQEVVEQEVARVRAKYGALQPSVTPA